jgi:hypothetical protein
MGVQIVEDYHILFGLWIKHIGHDAHHFSPFDAPPLIPDLDVTLSSQWFEEHEQIGDATSFVFVIRPFWFAWLHGKRLLGIHEKLFGHFINANQRAFRVIGLLVDFQNVFHIAHECGTGLGWDTPLFSQPGFELIFLSVVRIVS